MIELSPDLEKLLQDVLQEHGEAFLKCAMANCASIFDGNKISISEDCIKALIAMIEEEKEIAMEEAQKEELKLLMQYQEEELKRWFAMLMGLKLTPGELERMTLWDVLRGGKKSLFDTEEEPEGIEPSIFKR